MAPNSASINMKLLSAPTVTKARAKIVATKITILVVMGERQLNSIFFHPAVEGSAR